MIPRRVAEHMKAHNWFAVGVDLAIVVLGVFLGLQVSNWNEARHDEARRRVYSERLESDFEGIRARIGEHLTVFEEAIDGGDYILSVISASEAELGEMTIDKERMGRAFDRLTSNRIPPPAAATYAEMVSEGQLSRLIEPTLRNRLVEYDRLLGVVQEVSRNVTDATYQSLPVLYRHFDTRTVPDDSALSGIRQDVSSFDVAGMRSDREFAIAVNLMRRNALNSLQQRRIQMKRIDEILALLEDENAKEER